MVWNSRKHLIPAVPDRRELLEQAKEAIRKIVNRYLLLENDKGLAPIWKMARLEIDRYDRLVISFSITFPNELAAKNNMYRGWPQQIFREVRDSLLLIIPEENFLRFEDNPAELQTTAVYIGKKRTDTITYWFTVALK